MKIDNFIRFLIFKRKRNLRFIARKKTFDGINRHGYKVKRYTFDGHTS